MPRRRYHQLTTSHLLELAATLRAIAEEVSSPHANAVQESLYADATSMGYPTRSSGSASTGGPGNQVDEHGNPIRPDTPTEAAALNPDRWALRASADLNALTVVADKATDALRALQAHNPNRPTEICRACGYYLDRGETRCRRVDADTGRQCTGRPDTEQHCANSNCGAPLTPGKIRQGRCPACAEHVRTKGTERIPRSGLALGDNVIVEGGVAHAS